MDTSLLDMEIDPNDPNIPRSASGAPAGIPPLGVQPVAYTPPPAVTPAPRPAMTPGTTAGLPAPQIPASGLPPPSMGGPAVPSKSVTDQESTSITSRTKVSPEERAAQAKLDQDNEDLAHTARVKGQLANQEAAFQEQAAEKKRQILETHGENLKKLVEGADKEWNAANERYQTAFETARNEKPKDFWGYDDNGKARADTGQRKFWAGIAIALSAFSERDNGGHNTAFDMISGAIERRDKTERERINRMREDAQSLKGERDVVLAKKHEKLADLSAAKAAQYDLAASELETRLAAMGRPKAEIETNADVLKLRQKRDEERAQFSQVTRQEIKNQVVTKTQQIVGGAGAQQDKPLQQWKPEERKAEGFAMRAYKASEQMESTKYSPADMQVLTNAARREALNGGMTGMADKAWKLLNVSTYNQLSPEGKKRYNATREFIISGLRPESGAAISMGEIADAEQRYGTVPGDTKATAPQKKQMRMSKIAEVGLQTGRPQFWIQQTGAYGQQGAPAASAGAPPAVAKPSGGLPPGAVPGTLNGKRGYALNGKFIPLEMAAQ